MENKFYATCALVLDEEGDIDLLLPHEDEQSEAALFLMAIFHRLKVDDEFYKANISWMRNHMDLHQELEPEDKVH